MGFNVSYRGKIVWLTKQATCDNITSLKNMQWTFNNEYINIRSFDCGTNPSEQIYAPIDIRKTKKLIVPKPYEFRRTWKMKL